MVFSSAIFLFLFLPLTLGIFFVLPRCARTPFLVAASFVFYAWGEPTIVPLLTVSVLLNWAIALAVERLATERTRRLAVGAAVALNIGALGYFKYTNLLVATVDRVRAALGLGPLGIAPVPLPIGVSFVTFEALAYVVDVYRREIVPARNPLHVAFYVSFFPHLIAGPILRFRNVVDAVGRPQPTLAQFDAGVSRFIAGLAKKMLIANPLGLVVDHVFELPPAQCPTSTAWLVMIAYTLQIYFDFSGYSDMAIGMGKMFGFELPENFRRPYAAESVRDFWRRWHISLSTWFRDYLFIPLGGSRHGAARTHVNLLAVFLLCGLWHGARWTFVIWGAYHGVFLVLERTRFGAWLAGTWRPVRHAYTLLVVLVGWVFFRADSISQACDLLAALVGVTGGLGPAASSFANRGLALPLLAGLIVIAVPWNELGERWLRERSPSRAIAIRALGVAAQLAALAVSLVFVAGGAYNPFIYYRF